MEPTAWNEERKNVVGGNLCCLLWTFFLVLTLLMAEGDPKGLRILLQLWLDGRQPYVLAPTSTSVLVVLRLRPCRIAVISSEVTVNQHGSDLPTRGHRLNTYPPLLKAGVTMTVLS